MNISTISGVIFRRRSQRFNSFNQAKLDEREYFYLMKAIRRLLAAITMTLLAFKAVATFLSWVEKQEDSEADAWIDEDEFEDA